MLFSFIPYSNEANTESRIRIAWLVAKRNLFSLLLTITEKDMLSFHRSESEIIRSATSLIFDSSENRKWNYSHLG